MTMNVKGWIPDSPDPRDLPYSMVKPTTLRLFGRMTRPKKVDLRRPFFPPVFDQGDLGSCVSQAWCGAMSFAEAKHGTFSRVFSRLANYLHTRELTGDRVVDKDGKLIMDNDSGSSIRDGIKAVKKNGIGVESLWPYDVTKWNVHPTPEYEAEGLHRKDRLRYFRLTNQDEILDCLASGWPVVFGAAVYESFMNPIGIAPTPRPNERPVGGHAMLIVGYDLKLGRYLIRNSWGEGWGDEGHIWTTFDYLNPSSGFASDFWTLRRIAF